MARFERLEPRADDMPVFDGNMDEDDAEEGSRLPLLIVIALLVLAAFAGVVWLAYTQGVERGRADAPRVIVAGNASASKLKVYQQPAPADDSSADADSVPPPPTPMTSAEPQTPAPANAPAAATQMAPAGKPALPAATVSTPGTPEVKPKSVAANSSTQPAANAAAAHPATPAPQPAQTRQRVATHAPAPLSVPPASETAAAPVAAPSTGTAENSGAPAGVAERPAPVETPPATPAARASGGYLLQIGAYKSQDEADTAWNAFQKQHPIVGGYESNVRKVDLGEKGTWYRLRIGSFADKDAAVAFCAKLKADGASCLVAR